jgi:hypothetical protein
MKASSRTQAERHTEDVAADLGLLRKFEGFIERRLDQVPSVRALLKEDPDDTFERTVSRFLSAIHSLDDDEAALLLDVFALSPETRRLTRLQERRKAHGEKIGRGVETVAAREERALPHLLTKLLTGRYTQSPLVIQVPEMHDGIMYEATSTLIVVENRRWKETREHYRFAATFDEMDYVTVTRSYPGRTTPHSEGDFKVNTRAVEGAGWNDHFWHLNKTRTATEPMVRGGVYDLKFTIDPDVGSGADSLTLASRAFHERSLLATIQVRFLGETPANVWTYTQASPFARPTKPDEHNRTTLDERGIATVRLRDAHGGLFTGIAWDWRR